MLMTDFDDDPKVSSRSSLLNHVDFIKYDTLHEELIKQGHHVYNGIIFKEESFNKMELIGS